MFRQATFSSPPPVSFYKVTMTAADLISFDLSYSLLKSHNRHLSGPYTLLEHVSDYYKQMECLAWVSGTMKMFS